MKPTITIYYYQNNITKHLTLNYYILIKCPLICIISMRFYVYNKKIEIPRTLLR